MKKHVSKYYILLLLALMFAAPGIAAYYFFQHPSWLGTATVNKGSLLKPAVELTALDESNKWRIIVWSPAGCDKVCVEQLNRVARTRLALGRKLYQVDQWLILGESAEPLTQEIQSTLKDQDFHVAQLTQKVPELSKETAVYLANPGKYLILSYSSPSNPNDIYKDLKLLLNTAENKSGM